MVFSVHRTKQVAFPGQGIECTLLPDLGPQTMSHTGPGPHPAPLLGQGS